MDTLEIILRDKKRERKKPNEIFLEMKTNGRYEQETHTSHKILRENLAANQSKW